MVGMSIKWFWRAAWLAWATVGAGGARLAADIADDLARISVEAEGGAVAMAALRAFKADGVTRVGEQEVIFILYAARPRSVRIETLGEKGSLVRSFDGVLAPWRKDGPAEPSRRLGRAEELEFIREADFDSPLREHRARGISLDYAGEVTIGGRVSQKLLATLRGGELVTLYLDGATRLLVRRDTPKRVGGRDIVVETHYADHRAVAGVLLPHRIRTESGGRVLNETTIRAYLPNPFLLGGFFSPPDADWPRL